jgi:O-antigen/teichoic acid export membrane protein
VTTLTLWIVKPFRPTLSIQRSAVRGIASYGGWASLLEVLAALAHRTDVAVVGNALGARALGLYTIAQRLPELVVGSVTWNLSIVAFPALSQRRDRGHESLIHTTLNLIRYSALFGIPMGAALAVLAGPLVVVLFSDKWADAAEIMVPLAILYGLVCIVFPLGDTFKALGRQPTMVVVNVVSLPITIAAMVAAAPAGVVAVAWARLGVTVATAIVWLVLIGRALRLSSWQIIDTLIPGFAAAAGATAAGLAARALVPGDSIGALVVASLAVGAGGLIALRIFARGEYQELRTLLHGRLSSAGLVPARWRTDSLTATVPVEHSVDLATAEAEPRTPSR